MSGDMEITFSSWKNAARRFDDVADSAPATLRRAVADTTDPIACSADGPSSVDAAVSLVLSAFSAVMQDGFITPLTEGLASEVDALVDTGKQLQDMEEEATELAKRLQDRM